MRVRVLIGRAVRVDEGRRGEGIEAAGPDDGQRLRAEGSESKRERLRTMQGL